MGTQADPNLPRPHLTKEILMSNRSVFVMRVKDDAWRVIRDGDRRPTVVTKTRDEAFMRAAVIADTLGGKVIELNSSGKGQSKTDTTTVTALKRHGSATSRVAAGH